MKLLNRVVFIASCTGVLIGCNNTESNSVESNGETSDPEIFKTGGNPVIQEGSADPSVRVFNDKVYIYSSHDLSKDSEFWIMKDWKVFSTDDLVNFTDHGIALKGTDISWAREQDHCWAPDCSEKNGKYYFYFPMSDVRGVWNGEIGVAVGDSPEGPFKDALDKPLVGSFDKAVTRERHIYNIDPAAFTDEDGKSYLFWGNGACLVAELNEDMISFNSKIHQIVIEDHQGYTEGPFVWKRKGIYYMLYSQGGGRSFDRLDYATSGHILGPYQYGGSIVTHGLKGNIHGSVFEFRGQWYVAYHDLFPTDKYRKTCFERIHYRQDGSIVEVLATRTGVGWYNASEKIEAEDYFEKSKNAVYSDHGDSGFYMHHLKDGQWLRFPNVHLPFDFTNHLSVYVSGSGETGKIELYLDGPDGIRKGEIEVSLNAGTPWQVLETEVDSFSGIHDLYLKITGQPTTLIDLDWFWLF